jgi:hypothetical protein
MHVLKTLKFDTILSYSNRMASWLKIYYAKGNSLHGLFKLVDMVSGCGLKCALICRKRKEKCELNQGVVDPHSSNSMSKVKVKVVQF